MVRKITVGVVFIVAASLIAVPSWAKGYENKKAAGTYQVTLKVDRYPLVKGNNAVTVGIADKAGKAVTNAKVSVRYYMPAMPGMAPMSYTAQPALKGQEYGLTADIPMEGGWKFEVTVGDDSATFNLDAR
jgi:nitrogen fixation protein FixH